VTDEHHAAVGGLLDDGGEIAPIDAEVRGVVPRGPRAGPDLPCPRASYATSAYRSRSTGSRIW
jgi:hypothetical protein